MKGKYSNIILIAVLAIIVGGGIYWYSQYSTEDIYVDSLTSSEKQAKLAATLAYQQGEVMAEVDKADWAIVETDTVLHEGDAVKTGLDSKAIIELENGDVIRLGYSTEIVLTSLQETSVKIEQVLGASYNRVAKNTSRTYKVVAGDTTIQALGTAFNVVRTTELVDVAVVESKVNIAANENGQELTAGKQAIIKNDAVEVYDINSESLTNDWYTWNREEDSKKEDSLGIMEPFAGPDVTITSPDRVVTVTKQEATIVGTVSDVSAKISVNGTEIDNENGAFSHAVVLAPGKNLFTIVAENSSGYKTIKEVKIIYQTQAAATPIKLEASTEDDGVHLSWSESTGSTFQNYKIVRSEGNANLNYPDDGFIAALRIGEESYIDKDVTENGTYYYRVCEVMAGDQVFCSNVAHMKGKQAQEKEQEQNQEQNNERVGIFLSGEAKTGGIFLEWEVENMTISHGFKVVKGSAGNPVYPGNDYKLISDNNANSYAWDITDGQTYHFRVCEYNGSDACLVYSNDIAVTATGGADEEDDTEGSASAMSVTAEETGVGIWWTDTSSNPGFKYYKIVRSESNSSLRYPEDGYIAVKSKDETSYRDFSAVNGKKYYYRICTVGDTTFCSNVEQVTAINNNAVPSAVTLSGSFNDGKMNLTWTKSNEADFKNYRLVWSDDDSTPEYSNKFKEFSYIASLSFDDEGKKSGSRTEDVNLTEGTHYYSICVVDQADQVKCSNTVTLADGEVQ